MTDPRVNSVIDPPDDADDEGTETFELDENYPLSSDEEE